MWCFTDESVGLREEPFVSTINSFIDYLVKDISNAKDGFSLMFSQYPFPDYTGLFVHVGEDECGIGNYYKFVDIVLTENRSEYDGAVGWLCPALMKYFDKAPKEIYVKVESINKLND